MSRFLRDEGDAGGTGEGSAAKSTDDPGSSAAGSTDTGEGQKSTSVGGSDDDKSPVLSEKEQLEKASADLTTMTKAHDELKSKVGKQGDELGPLRNMLKSAKESPRDFIETLKKSPNYLSTAPRDTTSDLEVLFGEESSVADKTAALTSMRNADRIASESRMDALVDPIREAELARRYSDWDERADVRNSVALMRSQGQLSDAEIDHLVSKAMDIPGALEAAGKKAVETYVQGLQDKGKEHLTGTSTSTDTKKSSDEATPFTAVLEQLKEM